DDNSRIDQSTGSRDHFCAHERERELVAAANGARPSGRGQGGEKSERKEENRRQENGAAQIRNRSSHRKNARMIPSFAHRRRGHTLSPANLPTEDENRRSNVTSSRNDSESRCAGERGVAGPGAGAGH